MPKIVIRNRHDHSRFIGRHRWIIGERRARVFPSAHAAIVFSHEHELEHDAEVLVRFGEPGTADVIINLPAEVSTGGSGEEWAELADMVAPA